MANPSSIFLMLGASFCFACAAILTKSLGTNVFGEGVHPLQIAHARFLFSFILLVSFWYIFKPKVKFSNVKLHLFRSIFGWLGVSILFTSILYIPVSDATALTFLNPIFAMIFAVLIFKEKVGLIRWGAALFSFSGGLLLLRPSLDLSVDPVALLCLFGALIMGLEIICIKILSGKDSVFTILILNNFFAMCIGTLVVPFFFVLPGFLESIVLLTIGIFMLTGQFCFINSLKGAETSFLMPFFYTTLIFVISLDLIIFNSLPDKISYIGAFIIILGSIIVAFREWRVKLKLSVKKIL